MELFVLLTYQTILILEIFDNISTLRGYTLREQEHRSIFKYLTLNTTSKAARL